VVVPLVGSTGRVLAFDLLPMAPLEGVEFTQGDFTEEAEADRLDALLEGGTVDLVLSDMAPNVSGMKAVDQPRAIYLAELALGFALTALKPGGSLVVKAFHGEGFDALVRQMRQHFGKVVSRKPKASRAQSRETYLVAKGLRVG
jgi:23S rRNA (uridine2552-2'-O)-methyltransferase